MFNEGGEIDLFNKLNFNAVFYGEVLSGSSMPNLMYMTSFENKADRDAHWKSFGAGSRMESHGRLASISKTQFRKTHNSC